MTKFSEWDTIPKIAMVIGVLAGGTVVGPLIWKGSMVIHSLLQGKEISLLGAILVQLGMWLILILAALVIYLLVKCGKRNVKSWPSMAVPADPDAFQSKRKSKIWDE